MLLDATFRDLFHTGPVRLLELLGIASPAVLLPNEYNVNVSRRPDWVAWARDKRLCHIEFQSFNMEDAGERMLDCWYVLRRQYKVAPYQVILYAGEEKLRMPSEVREGGMHLSYKVVDLRSLPAAELLASPSLEDNLLSTLCRFDAPRTVAKQLSRKLDTVSAAEAQEARDKLAVLCKLRQASGLAKYLELAMPIQIDLREFPDTYKRVMRDRELATRQGLEQGREQGRELGQGILLQELLEGRFGRLPAWTRKRLANADSDERVRIGHKMFTAKSLRELFDIGKRSR